MEGVTAIIISLLGFICILVIVTMVFCILTSMKINKKVSGTSPGYNDEYIKIADLSKNAINDNLKKINPKKVLVLGAAMYSDKKLTDKDPLIMLAEVLVRGESVLSGIDITGGVPYQLTEEILQKHNIETLMGFGSLLQNPDLLYVGATKDNVVNFILTQ